MPNSLYPFAHWQGHGDRTATARIIISDQDQAYIDRYGCRFVIPARVEQRHFEVPGARRWVVWRDHNGVRHIRDVGLAKRS